MGLSAMIVVISSAVSGVLRYISGKSTVGSTYVEEGDTLSQEATRPLHYGRAACYANGFSLDAPAVNGSRWAPDHITVRTVVVGAAVGRR